MSRETKTAYIVIRIKPSDKEKIAAAAKRADMTVTEYVEMCIESHELDARRDIRAIEMFINGRPE